MGALKEEKRRYYENISNRLLQEMKRRGVNQEYINSRLPTEMVQQGAVSKILNYDGKNSPQLYNLVEIARVLDIDLNKLLYEANEEDISRSVETGGKQKFITDPASPEMRAYLNTYYVWFFSTKKQERNLHKGHLIIEGSEDGAYTQVRLTFKTGKKDERGSPITKAYTGRLGLSPMLGIAYCRMVNNDTSVPEVSYMIFNYFTIAAEKLLCRIALVLTPCAGQKRYSTAHRMIISARDLTDEQVNIIKGHLFLNERKILISERKWKKYLQDSKLSQAVKEKLEQDVAQLKKEPYYSFREHVFFDETIDHRESIIALSLIRSYAESPMRNKIGKCDDYLHEYISSLSEGAN